MNAKVLVEKIHDDAKLPYRAHKNDSGADLFAVKDVVIAPRSSAKIATGICLALAEGTSGLIWGRSSLESAGLKVVAGLIDAGYRGEVMVCMFNLTDVPVKLAKGQKIAQLVIVPTHYPDFETCDNLPQTERGTGGFGSTGKN
jgi:dUTP pyrophosphatase